MRFVHGYANLAQRRDWSTRGPLALEALATRVRASVLSLVECDHGQALEVCARLGWGDEARPSHRTDENRNSVAWDPAKWRDVSTIATSLSAEADDLGDRHYRSALWVLLEHKATGVRLWIGASHLSNGAPEDRPVQARVLVEGHDGVGGVPQTGHPVLLGIDRNAWPSSSPSRILAGVLPLLSPDLGDSFTGDGVQDGRPPIDGLHGVGLTAAVTQLHPGAATDHTLLRAIVTVPEGTAL